MKIHFSICLSFLGAISFAHSQTYSVTWSSADGGGGFSDGGGYHVAGTIGQADAGPSLAGGGYAAIGGFWAAFGAQSSSDERPTLRLQPNGIGFVRVTWTPPTAGFLLQVSDVPSGHPWTTLATKNSDSIPATSPSLFYRLVKP